MIINKDFPQCQVWYFYFLLFCSIAFTTTRTLHRGLDTESDVDDGTESTVPLRATPLTARSGTPLGRAGTPVNRSRVKTTLPVDTPRGGYTLAKGAIAEDLEEEEKPKSKIHRIKVY